MPTQPSSEEGPMESFPYPENDDFYARNIYTHLDQTKDEIRLVRVLPGDQGEPIHCELVQNISLSSLQEVRPGLTDNVRFEKIKREVFRSVGKHPDGAELKPENLDHEDCSQQGFSGIKWCEVQGRHLALPEDDCQSPVGDEYYALSYAAGNLHNTEPITVAGVPFNVYSSIAEAIRRLRFKSRTLQIWIDQICINQRDISEKSDQVGKMKEIYRKANEVLIWLGFSHGNNEASVKSCLEFCWVRSFMLAYGKEERGPRMYATDSEDAQNSKSLAVLESRIIKQILSKLSPGSPACRDLSEWSNLPWFGRCWTLQEAAVAYKATFIYGSQTWSREMQNGVISVLRRIAIARLMAKSEPQDNGKDLYADIESSLGHFRDLFGLDGKLATLKLSDALILSRRAQCTDPRDHVYSMLGLVGSYYGIRPDYRTSNSTKNVFAKATRAIIEHEGSLDVLARGSEQQRHLSPHCLPWWVPDFSRMQSRSTLVFVDGTQKESEKRYIPDPRLRFLADAAGDPSAILECSGRILSSLVAAPAALGKVGAASDEASTSALLANWKSCIAYAGIEQFYPPTQEIADMAFRSAMSLGKSMARTGGEHSSVYKGTVSEIMQAGAWRFFVSPGGYMGFAPWHVNSDALLALLVNCAAVLVVREISKKSDHGYQLLGAAYLHGFDIDKEFQGKLKDEAEISALQTIRLL